MRDRLKSTLNSASKAVSDTATSITDNVSAAYSGSVDAINSTVQGARNFGAGTVSTTGAVLGTIGGVAGEVSLITAGFFPFLILGGLPTEMGAAFSAACDQLSQVIRGSNPQFVGVNKVDKGLIFSNHDMNAIIYDPLHLKANAAGFIQIDELAVANMISELESREQKSDRQTVYMAALLAVQHAKKEYGIELKFQDMSVNGDNTKAPEPKP